MKIAFLLPSFPVISQTFILNQMTWFLDQGHQVDIFARKRSGEKKVHEDVERYHLMDRTYFYWDIPQNKFQRIVSACRLIQKNFSKNPVGIFRALNVMKYGNQALSLGLLHRVGPFLNDYDILQCHFGREGNWGVFLKEFGVTAKVITTFHGFDIRLGLKKGGHIYKQLFEKGDSFVSISDYNFQSLCHLGLKKEKIVSLPVGIDLKKFPFTKVTQVQDPPVQYHIVTVARLVEEKGLQYGIEAVDQLRRKRPNVKLRYIIIGEGPLRPTLERLVNVLRLEEVVSLPGALEQKEIVRELLRSHLFLLPSVAEALPVSLMEAQAIGLPIIATRVGSADLIVSEGQSGFLVPDRDVEALAERCIFLVDHPEVWLAMGQKGREIVAQRYDVNMLNVELLHLYQKALGACV